MAATNVNNLDAISGITNVDSTEAALLTKCVRAAIMDSEQGRMIGLFTGQMRAEGFVLSNGNGMRSYVESPTARVEHWILDTGIHQYRKSLGAGSYAFTAIGPNQSGFGKGVLPAVF